MQTVHDSKNKPTTTIEIPISDLESSGAIGCVVAVAEKLQSSPGQAMMVILGAVCGKATEELSALRSPAPPDEKTTHAA